MVHPGCSGDTDHSVGVYVLWQKPDEPEARVLIHRRSRHLRSGRGLVSACPGGRVAASGTFRDSAVRELEEETGMSVDPRDLEKVFAHDYFGSCSMRGCPHRQRVVYRLVIGSAELPSVPGPQAAHAWEIDQAWGRDATVGVSAGQETGYRWATPAELRLMHQDRTNPDKLWLPGGLGDIEIRRVLNCALLDNDNERGGRQGPGCGAALSWAPRM